MQVMIQKHRRRILTSFFRKLTIDNSDLGMIQPKALSGMLGVQELSIINSKIDKVGGNILSAESQVKSVKLEGNHLLAIPADFDYMVRIYIGCPKKCPHVYRAVAPSFCRLFSNVGGVFELSPSRLSNKYLSIVITLKDA